MSRGQDCYWIDSQGSIPHTYIHNIYPAPKAVLLKLKNWIHMQSRKWGQKDYKIETNRCWTLWLCLIHRQVLFWAFLEISITPLTFLQTRPGVDLSSGLQNHRFSLLCFSPVLHLCDDVQGCVCVRTCMHMLVHMFMEAAGQHQESLFRACHLSSETGSLLLNLELTDLAEQAGRQDWEVLLPMHCSC